MTSLVEIYRRFPDHESCIAHLEAVRWPDGPLCPYCGAERVSHNRDATRGLTSSRWKCQRCKRSFSATVGTIFHRSHVDLQRWFLLIALMLGARKRLSAMQAARDLDMRRPTVWSMMHRVRKALADDGRLLAGIVEMDETRPGGKPRKKNRRRDDPPGGQGVGSRTPIIGAAGRGGRVKARPAGREEMTGDDPAEHFRAMVGRPCGPVHTDTIDGCWSLARRAICGRFHHVGRKYLPLCLGEISFRHDMRNGTGAFDKLLHPAVNP